MENSNQRAVKPTFRRDWMAEAVREAVPGTEWRRVLAKEYRNERVRRAFNDAEDAAEVSR